MAAPPPLAQAWCSDRAAAAAAGEDVAAVWDFNRSAEMRDTEGGSSKRSVMEQVDKMRAYLAANAAQA
jgi:argininosuccinate lyase